MRSDTLRLACFELISNTPEHRGELPGRKTSTTPDHEGNFRGFRGFRGGLEEVPVVGGDAVEPEQGIGDTVCPDDGAKTFFTGKS